MGKVAKAVVGIALVVAAPFVAASLIGAAGVAVTATGFYAVQAAVTIVGASIAGSAASAELPDTSSISSDTYAGQILQTQKSNTAAVSVPFGEVKLGSNIIFQVTNSEVTSGTNKDYWAIQVISEGEINDYLALYANEDVMVDKGSNIHTLKYVHIKAYNTSGSSGIDLDDVYFATTQAGVTESGSDLNLTNFSIPENVAFLAVHQVYEATDSAHTGLDTITARIQGSKVKQINSTTLGADIYSDNPSECVLDVMMNGLNIPETDINIPSFYNAKIKCNSYGYTSNVVFNTQSNIQSVISSLLSTFRGQVVYSQGKWKLKLDEKSLDVVKTLNDDDILNQSLNISMKGFSDIANNVIFKYINPSDEWLSAQINVQDNDLIEYDGQQIDKTLDVKAVTNSSQAMKLAEITLNTMRYTEDNEGNRIKQTPIVLEFTTTIKHADLEVGDVIGIDHNLLDRTRRFIILSTETDQSGIIKIVTRETAETHFKNSVGNYLI